MQQAIDVLEVLDIARQVADQQRMDAIESGNGRLEASKQFQIDNIREARVASADLIERDKRLNAAIADFQRTLGVAGELPYNVRTKLDILLNLAGSQAAALARVSAMSA